MKFVPKSEKEIQEEKLLPKGEYPFQISQAEDKLSKAGNEMLVLTVRVYKPDGSFVLVNDYLMESMAFKLRHAAEACGLLSEYDSGLLLPEMFIGKTGDCKLGIQVDKTGAYADRNTILDYIVPKNGAVKKPLPKDALTQVLEDEIPF